MLIATLAFFLWALPQNAVGTDLPDRLQFAESLCKRKKFQEAENAYKSLLVAFPNDSQVLTKLGRCYLAMGRSRDAAQTFNEVLLRKSDDYEANLDMAHALVDLNRFVPAEHILKKLVGDRPGDGESWYYLGVLMYQNGYFGAADADFEKAAHDPSRDVERKTKLEIYRAVCWVHLGRTNEAETAMKRLANDPAAQKDPDLLLVFAQLLYETNRSAEALQRIDQAIAARPDLAMGYFWRGKVLYGLGRLPEAAQAEEKASKMIPDYAYPRSLLVKIYQAQGRMEKAAEQAEWLRANEARQN
jgi:tetratricopeptide (TPR) repeat protein